MKAPFPYFGGKSRAAPEVWERFGDVKNYVEPFFGSGAVLLSRPHWPFQGTRTETVNDIDGMIANFWRATKADPQAVAYHADWPVNECDLHARHLWLVRRKDGLAERLMGDPDYFDAKAAGWWVWGLCCWIGSGWCSGNGPWTEAGGELIKNDAGRGINRQMPHLGNAGTGTNKPGQDLQAVFLELADRLRNVRVCCGDWSRVCGDSVTFQHGVTGVFLDPPYADTADRQGDLYACDSLSVAHDVREWAIEAGRNPLMRVCLAGYEGEHAMPDNWECVVWKAAGGYGSQGDGKGRENAGRERLWFSPACIQPAKARRLI
jgi:DNA adenine methylase